MCFGVGVVWLGLAEVVVWVFFWFELCVVGFFCVVSDWVWCCGVYVYWPIYVIVYFCYCFRGSVVVILSISVGLSRLFFMMLRVGIYFALSSGSSVVWRLLFYVAWSAWGMYNYFSVMCVVVWDGLLGILFLFHLGYILCGSVWDIRVLGGRCWVCC